MRKSQFDFESWIAISQVTHGRTGSVEPWAVHGSLVKTISSIELPDTANLDCYHDQFEEKNLTTLMIGQRSNKIDVNRFSFLGNIEMNGNDICVGIGFWNQNMIKGH